jgi:hypothetical protein
MTKGSVVYIAGADNSASFARLALADADTEETSSKVIGLLLQDIPTGGFGYVIVSGTLEGVNTSTANSGDSAWLSSTPGGIVYGAPPAKPAHAVYLGVVVRSNTNNGKIEVKVQNGYELNEIHDVVISSATSGQVLKLNGSGLWVNSAISTGLTWNQLKTGF